MQAAGPAFKTASANARRNKAVYGRILTTTPGDKDSAPCIDAMEIIETTCRWTEQFYDMSKEEIQDYVSINAPDSGIVYVEYNYKQLGEGEEWLNEMARLLFNDKVAIRREIHLQRISGSSASPYDADELAAIADIKRKPIREDMIMGNKFKFDIYEEIDRTKVYIIGVDTSTGIGKDYNAFTVVDPDTLRPVMEFRCQYISSPDLKRVIFILMKKYTPRGILAIERNMGGYSLIDHLRETEIKPRIYFENMKDVDSTIDERLDAKGFLVADSMARRYTGINTTGKSRELMFAILTRHVKEHKDSFVTQNITDDLMKLIVKASGKIEAASGFHDDSIMSYLIALYVYYHGKNLARFGYIKGEHTLKPENLNQGLYSEEQQILASMPSDLQGLFRQTKTQEQEISEYEAIMQRARAKADAWEAQLGTTHGAHSVDLDDTGGSINLSFFDELNS